MASPDIDQTGRERVEVAGVAGGLAGGQLPRGGHSPMSIGQVSDTATGQPVRSDGVAAVDSDPTETTEWLDSLRYVINSRGPDRAAYLLHAIEQEAYQIGRAHV